MSLLMQARLVFKSDVTCYPRSIKKAFANENWYFARIGSDFSLGVFRDVVQLCSRVRGVEKTGFELHDHEHFSRGNRRTVFLSQGTHSSCFPFLL